MLMSFLLANVITTPPITWILGDPGMSAPTSLPFGYVIPLYDSVKPLSGVDMDTYVTPILIVDDLHNYGAPVDNANAPGTFEQPGYRKLMQFGQTTRQALRAGGAGITLEGNVAVTALPSIGTVWLQIDGKPYRGARLAVQAQTRRARTVLPA